MSEGRSSGLFLWRKLVALGFQLRFSEFGSGNYIPHGAGCAGYCSDALVAEVRETGRLEVLFG